MVLPKHKIGDLVGLHVIPVILNEDQTPDLVVGLVTEISEDCDFGFIYVVEFPKDTLIFTEDEIASHKRILKQFA